MNRKDMICTNCIYSDRDDQFVLCRFSYVRDEKGAVIALRHPSAFCGMGKWWASEKMPVVQRPMCKQIGWDYAPGTGKECIVITRKHWGEYPEIVAAGFGT